MNKYIVIITIILLGSSAFSLAQESQSEKQSFFSHNIDYQVRAQFSIGGSSPLGLPREIRSIDSYNPTMQLGLQAHVTKWFSENSKWGMRVGIGFDGKGMKTKATVKNYKTEIIQQNEYIGGYFTGKVKTKVNNTYFTVPVSAVYKLSDNWQLYGGLYVSALVDKTFDGSVSDGYLKQDSPTGSQITFEADSSAPYDFSSELNNFQWGAQFGGEFKLNGHFVLFGDLTYGINQLLDKDFTSIDFSMHNIYLNLGFGYKF